jgi:hypothetical protein
MGRAMASHGAAWGLISPHDPRARGDWRLLDVVAFVVCVVCCSVVYGLSITYLPLAAVICCLLQLLFIAYCGYWLYCIVLLLLVPCSVLVRALSWLQGGLSFATALPPARPGGVD